MRAVAALAEVPFVFRAIRSQYTYAVTDSISVCCIVSLSRRQMYSAWTCSTKQTVIRDSN